MKKVCKTCGQAKSLEDFHRTTKSPDGRRAHCKPCRNRRERTEFKESNERRYKAWAREHPERIAEIRRRFHERHPERQREYARRWRWESDGLEVLRRAKRRRRYGRDPEDLEFADILLADPCAFCGSPADTVDHIEPKARGGNNGWENLTAACRSCNSRKSARPLLTYLMEKTA